MIFIGTDIVEVKRIENLIFTKGTKFLSHIYSDSEIEYCSNKQQPSIHYAGKFAGKEAVKKALLSSNLIESIPVNQISILNDKFGAPYVKLENNYPLNPKLVVSVSHTDLYATATAIIEINE